MKGGVGYIKITVGLYRSDWGRVGLSGLCDCAVTIRPEYREADYLDWCREKRKEKRLSVHSRLSVLWWLEFL